MRPRAQVCLMMEFDSAWLIVEGEERSRIASQLRTPKGPITSLQKSKNYTYND